MKFSLKFFFLILIPLLVFAQNSLEVEYPSIPGVEVPTLLSPFEAEHLIRYIRYIFNFGIFSGIIFALLILIFAGLRYLYSLDNPQIRADAKNQIFNAFLGLLLLVISYNILALLNPDFVVLNPLPLQSRRLFIDFLRRIERISLEDLVRTLEPTQIPLEVFYPELQGFRPSVIPFTYALPHYPLNELIAQYIRYVYNWAIIIGIILALLFLILGGVKYLSARGNVGLLTEAKIQIVASLLGLLLLLISFGLLRTLRPEYTIISPAELPEIEVKIPEGIYFCSERAPMGNRGLDLFQEYILNELYRKYVDPNSRFLFTRRIKAELSIFVQTFCERIATSQNLPIEVTGGQIQLTHDEINELLSLPGLTPEERQQILQDLLSLPSHLPKRHIYINGPYGIILHEKPNFKGRGIIFLIAEYAGDWYNNDTVNIQNYNPPLFAYRHISDWVIAQMGGVSSITVFYDLVFKCWLESPTRSSTGEAEVKYCLEIPSFDIPNLDVLRDALSFYLFTTQDFGGFEEKTQTQPSLAQLDYKFELPVGRLDFLTTGGEGKLTKTGFETLRSGIPYAFCKPCFSLKFPREKDWIFVGAKEIVVGRPPEIFVTDKSERDLSPTYAREFCEENGVKIPCLGAFWAWPAVIIKASQ